ncbi:MAG: hypothetical protein QW456_08780 [Ignisphaera sp.]
MSLSNSMFPCAVPIKLKSIQLNLSESKRMAMLLSSSLKPVKIVTDGSTFYHSLYSEISVSDKVIPVQEVIAKSVHVGKICDLLKRVESYTITYIENNRPKTDRIFPIIVVYKDNVWEHLSVAPIKIVENCECMLNEDYGLGIVVAKSESEHMRPYAYTIIRNPTTVVLLKKCNITEEKNSRRGSLR